VIEGRDSPSGVMSNEGFDDGGDLLLLAAWQACPRLPAASGNLVSAAAGRSEQRVTAR
jgi:hypothetical protein